ncbi:Protein phosphatase 1 regulatory subunit 37 [Eumeta japonica]|uniref:Protein phosphatase 1 regulatory subunit 37 n=1 Tax=Eumeta variegata TaxID=151549 RepID=A0A4C1T3P1_EUMVA|nr:Protein phosphatase 1 regulatory subunit 37 [Eumeta japonica]
MPLAATQTSSVPSYSNTNENQNLARSDVFEVTADDAAAAQTTPSTTLPTNTTFFESFNAFVAERTAVHRIAIKFLLSSSLPTVTTTAAPTVKDLLAETVSLELLNIGKNCLSNDFVSAIKDSLTKNTTLTTLGPQSAHLSAKGIETLSSILTFGGNSTLQRIDIRDNKLEVESLTKISEVLKSNTTVTQIDIDDEPKRLSVAASSFRLLWDIENFQVQPHISIVFAKSRKFQCFGYRNKPLTSPSSYKPTSIILWQQRRFQVSAAYLLSSAADKGANVDLTPFPLLVRKVYEDPNLPLANHISQPITPPTATTQESPKDAQMSYLLNLWIRRPTTRLIK